MEPPSRVTVVDDIITLHIAVLKCVYILVLLLLESAYVCVRR